MFPSGFPLGEAAPVGSRQDKPKCPRCARVRRPRPRVCLRKGCGHKYEPRRWNQRYCQDPECRREVRRWQAARRQASRRQAAEVKAQHAEAQRVRRQRAKSASQTAKPPEVTAARGHAAKVFFRFSYATGQGAMNPPSARSATRRGTAAPPAVRRFAKSWIASANGGLAARKQAI